MDGKKTLQQVVSQLDAVVERRGLEALSESSSSVVFMARPRVQEMLACLTRYRRLGLKQDMS